LTGTSSGSRPEHRSRSTALSTTLAVIVALAGLALLAQVAAAAPSRGFVGVHLGEQTSKAEVERLGRGRVGRIRTSFFWRRVEFEKGKRDWRAYDALMTWSAKAGTDVLPVLNGTPSHWAGGNRSTKPPRTKAGRLAFRTFVSDAVRRYGRGGSFWRDHPGLPARPIKYWQVWNEPNLKTFWGNPNAAEYVRLLQHAHYAIKARDPNAGVVLGGLPDSRSGIPMVRFLRDVYRVPNAKAFFDVVALHPYAQDERGVEGALVRARQTMRDARDEASPIWVTEIGWATGGASFSHFARTTFEGQATLLRRTYKLLYSRRSRYRLGAVIWHGMRDVARPSGRADWWGNHTGLFRTSGCPKPSWKALVGFTLGNAGSGCLPR